ncbi:GNAT family N-acetyltransferase [Sutcliffiella horikoshii]|uniref:GNAT family N-acetyltransferase n=1 Tax=Sutcliffiella horikoshii TaxID=79883 RepID=A0A5D4SYU1_9BACI|nr:GNAT family N-acetyltransferase [Sutcliffiella horikoshii]TYS67841.1 GNAT family N-acetyltransferase [Sutcliffiella horikoshii]
MNLFNIIKNKQEYWLVDQIKKEDVPTDLYMRELTNILEEMKRLEIGYLSLLMAEEYESWLLEKKFSKISSIVEYTRKLEGLTVTSDQIKEHSLAEDLIDDRQYAELYELCRSGSANKNTKQPIAQVMSSLESELGLHWRKHCYYFMKAGEIAGISIPHIEMGTEDEGRLFYFGVVPELRGQGIGARIHRVSMELLKKFQATYYVGSTDVNNINMIKIFEKNGCELRDKKGIYRIDR